MKWPSHSLQERVAAVTQRVADICAKRGICLKPFFDDAARDDGSVKLFGHVTAAQFQRCMNIMVGIRISQEEAAVLVDKVSCNGVGSAVPRLSALSGLPAEKQIVLQPTCCQVKSPHTP